MLEKKLKEPSSPLGSSASASLSFCLSCPLNEVSAWDVQQMLLPFSLIPPLSSFLHPTYVRLGIIELAQT